MGDLKFCIDHGKQFVLYYLSSDQDTRSTYDLYQACLKEYIINLLVISFQPLNRLLHWIHWYQIFVQIEELEPVVIVYI